MSQWRSKVWDILSPDEQMAINLQLVQNLSTLRAGEIMGKSHYKYLEIIDRAKAFIRIFSDWLDISDDVIPEFVNITPSFREYLRLVMVKRLSVKDACAETPFPLYLHKKYREKDIIENMEKLHNTESEVIRQFFFLIKDFDRWNNYRILPYEVQDPSAFKRRNKNAYIKLMRQVYSMREYTLKIIKDKYRVRDYKSKRRRGYFVLFSNKGHSIHGVELSYKRAQSKRYEWLGKLGIYIFQTPEQAEKYMGMVEEYFTSGTRTCTYGQRFWPSYRVLIEKSLNHNYVGKIIPSRKYFADVIDTFDKKYAI